jgi:serine/threonine protein kinase
VAWKRIPFDQSKYRSNEDFKEKVGIEVSLLKRFDHPNIVRYYDTEWDHGGVDIYMEWCEGSNLDTYISQNYRCAPDFPPT